MLIGHGLLAEAFSKYKNNREVIIFASGVSNSREEKQKEFDREKQLLQKTILENRLKYFIYFSTCSIEDPSQKDSFYVQHKINMEEIVKTLCLDYNIFRLPQVVGIGKSPTIINFFVDSILENNFFKVYGRATRNLISVEDVYNIADNFIVNKMATNKIINIATPFNTPVHKIVLILEKLLNKRAKYEVLDLGVEQTIDISYIVSSLKIKFDENYVEDILKKYLIKRGLM